MFCKNCGNPVDDNAVACPGCGAQVREFKVDGAEQQQASAPIKGNPVGLTGFILAMVGALCFLLSFAVGVFLYISIALDIAAIACSAVGWKKAKKLNLTFRGLSLAGMVVGIAVLAVSVVFLIWAIALYIQIQNALDSAFALIA